VVSFTIIRPDTPPVLAATQAFQADPQNWHFLTGTADDLRKLSWDTFHLNDISGKPGAQYAIRAD